MASERDSTGDQERKDELVEVTNDKTKPEKEIIYLKVEVNTVQWVGTDKEHWVRFRKDAWPFIENADTPDDGHGNSEIIVPHGTPSRPFKIKREKMGKHKYVIVSARTRDLGKPPNGPAVVGEG